MTFDKSQRIKHKTVIKSFLKKLNEESDAFILKGGTALMICYNLNRFSEDIDLDCTHQKLKEFVRRFCDSEGYSFRVGQETDTTHRFFIHYDENNKPLKIEVSYRNKKISPNTYNKVNGIQVYTIDRLCQLKSGAYQNRDKIRDLYDLSFIINHYYDKLSDNTINIVKDALSYKGFENFDYITSTQKDDLINVNVLADSYLKMYDKLELLYTKEEKHLIKTGNGNGYPGNPGSQR